MKRFLLCVICAALCATLLCGCLRVRPRGTATPTDEDPTGTAGVPAGEEDPLAAALAEQARQIAAFETRLNELENRGSGGPAATEPVTQAPTDPAERFRYTVSEDGFATVTQYIGSEETVVIPATLGGCPVVAVGEEAFKNGTPAAVVIPEGVRRVDWFAFGGCYRLATVTVPDTVVAIGYGAFDLCSPALCFVCSENSYAAGYARSYGIGVTEP